MSESDRKPARILRAAEIEATSGTFSHPWNPRSEMRGAMLGRPAGLTRTGLNLITLPPGKEAFVFHAHLYEEEWIYILAGRATLDDGDRQHELGPGDFVAFPTPSQAHQLRNTFDAPVTYLTGGENAPLDVAEYPKHGKRLVKVGGRGVIHDLANGEAMPGVEKL